MKRQKRLQKEEPNASYNISTACFLSRRPFHHLKNTEHTTTYYQKLN